MAGEVRGVEAWAAVAVTVKAVAAMEGAAGRVVDWVGEAGRVAVRGSVGVGEGLVAEAERVGARGVVKGAAGVREGRVVAGTVAAGSVRAGILHGKEVVTVRQTVSRVRRLGERRVSGFQSDDSGADGSMSGESVQPARDSGMCKDTAVPGQCALKSSNQHSCLFAQTCFIL